MQGEALEPGSAGKKRPRQPRRQLRSHSEKAHVSGWGGRGVPLAPIADSRPPAAGGTFLLLTRRPCGSVTGPKLTMQPCAS